MPRRIPCCRRYRDDPPDPTRPIKGCSFSPRCRYAAGQCHTEKPPLTAAESSAHQYACFHPIQIAAGVPA